MMQIHGPSIEGEHDVDIDLSGTFEAVVDPGVAIPGASSSVHGLTAPTLWTNQRWR